jgi:hypothetical protein
MLWKRILRVLSIAVNGSTWPRVHRPPPPRDVTNDSDSCTTKLIAPVLTLAKTSVVTQNSSTISRIEENVIL